MCLGYGIINIIYGYSHYHCQFYHLTAFSDIDKRKSGPSFNAYDRGVPEKTQPAVARACRVTLHVRPGDWLRPQAKK